jgi:putative phage-type endonuclease
MPRSKPTKCRRVLKLDDLSTLCETVEPALLIGPFKTELFSTPESHSCYEHNDLCYDTKTDSSEAVLFKMPWDDPSQLKFLRSIQPVTPESFERVFVNRTAADCEREQLCAQRTEEWHKARAFSVTASQFGASVGHNKYMSRPALLRHKISPHTNTFPQHFAKWGIEHEDHAEEAFIAILKERCNGVYTIDHPGLLKHPSKPWTACSPDGILRRWVDGVEVVELIEYKAPAYHREKIGHPYSKDVYNIPSMYLDQMQGSMWLIRNHDIVRGGSSMKGGWFVVWQPHALYVTYVPYVQDYANRLMENVHTFYKDDFVPACVEKINSTDTG